MVYSFVVMNGKIGKSEADNIVSKETSCETYVCIYTSTQHIYDLCLLT